MNRGKLIELVKDHISLYDSDNKDYSDFHKKEAAWIEIGKAMEHPGKECKKQWNSLRDTYRRLLKKKKDDAKKGVPPEKMKKWKFEEEMSFLSPFFKEKDSNAASTLNETNNFMDGEKIQIMLLENHDIFDDSVSETDESDSPTTHQLIKTSQDTVGKSLSIAKNVNNRPQIFAVPLMNYPYDKNMDSIEEDEISLDDKDIDLFFASIASTVKKFSKYNQAVAKARVFSIISELEIGEVSHKFENEG